MTQILHNSEPREITIGETLEWRKSLADYPASAGGTLSYSFRGAGAGFDVTATADGDDFVIEVTSSATTLMAVGAYYWEAWMNDGTHDFMVESGQAKVIRNLKSIPTTTTLDNRSPVKKILDAIEARIEGRVSADIQSYAIGNRQLVKIPIEQLIKLRDQYATLYAKERRRARVRRGGKLFQNIDVRFDKP